MKEEELKTAYYLRGWRLWIWRIFIKYVFPELKKGHEIHKFLIENNIVAHAITYCPVCKK